MISDDILFAYLDGSLAPEERKRVEDAINDDPELAGRVARHRTLEAAARASFAGDLVEPIPDRWIALVDDALLGKDDRTASLAAARVRRTPARPTLWTGGAAAAGLALGLVAATTLWTGEGQLVTERQEMLAASSAVGEALDTARSGVPVRLAGGRTLDVQLSVRAEDGRFCREAVIAGGSRSNRLVACRSDGFWRIAGLAEEEAGHTDFETASGAGSLDGIVDGLGGAPLDTQAESEAIKKGWR